jgi:N-acyl homoserine lactone hydrolase
MSIRKWLLTALTCLLGGGLLLAWTFVPRPLAVANGLLLPIPTARGPAGMSLHALLAGKMYNQAAMAYRGGSFLEQRVFGMGAILVQHPRGRLLFDTGFGSQVDQHVLTTPWLMRVSSSYEKEPTVAAQLAAAGIAQDSLTAVVLTHTHWDHVSGLADLPDVPVWVTQSEHAFVDGGDAATALARKLGTQRYVDYGFADGAYLGFAHSRDVFADGSVVLVPAPGHTPGSIIAFINLPDGKRYALVGDLVWQTEGIDLPAEKPWIARRMVDQDAAATRELIVHMHQLQALMPELIVVPAHDRRVWEKLPRLQ